MIPFCVKNHRTIRKEAANLSANLLLLHRFFLVEQGLL